MKKTLAYKLTLLGCASTCLINVAYANTQTSDENVSIYGLFPEVNNVSCNSLDRTYLYVLTNDSNDDEIEIEDFSIIIEEGDDFPVQNTLITVNQSLVPVVGGFPIACKTETPYDPHESCSIAVSVNSSLIECPEHPILVDAEIERALLVKLDAGSQTELLSPLDFDVTVLGAAEEYAVLADCISVGSGSHKLSKNDCSQGVGASTDDVGINEIVQVSQDIGFADDILDPDDLVLHDDAALINGIFYDYSTNGIIETPNFAAAADAQAAYESLKEAAYDGTDHCVGPQLDISGDITVTPSIYCLVDGRDDDYFVVDGTITFRGNHESLFVFVMPSWADDELLDDYVTLEIEDGADFNLVTSAGHVDSDNIIWVGADLIEFDTGTKSVGTFLTKGTILGDADFSPWSEESADPVGPAIITGRLIGIVSCDDFPLADQNDQCNLNESYVFLNSNTIVD